MIVDRIEEGFAVVERALGDFVNIPLSHIEGAVKDGSVLKEITDGVFKVDEQETTERKESLEQKLHDLFS